MDRFRAASVRFLWGNTYRATARESQKKFLTHNVLDREKRTYLVINLVKCHEPKIKNMILYSILHACMPETIQH